MIDIDSLKTWLLSEQSLWILWGLCFVFFLSMVVVLSYHWRPYYTFDVHVKTMRTVFYIGGTLLFILAGLLIFLR